MLKSATCNWIFNRQCIKSTQQETADKTEKNKIGGAGVLHEEEEDAVCVNFGRRFNTDPIKNYFLFHTGVVVGSVHIPI